MLGLVALYESQIAEPGKAGLFWMLLGFLGSFGFIRTSVHLIRAEVSWWPGNVTPGGLHIHHLVFGIVGMFITGALAFAIRPESPWLEVVALLFGVGAGLTLDEFALFLHLEDVYWSHEGRTSIDAVILAGVFMLLLFIGVAPFGVDDLNDGQTAGLVAFWITIGLNISVTVVTLLKGKLATGLVGMFLPGFSAVGALRLAKPTSPWAHRRYAEGSRKLERAEARFAADRRRVAHVKLRFVDLVMGQRGRRPGDPPAG